MISWITPQIAIGEYSDVVDLGDKKSIKKIKSLGEQGVTVVLNIMEEDRDEGNLFDKAWHKGVLVRYFLEPVPILCEKDCKVFVTSRETCATCAKNSDALATYDPFLQGLNLAECKMSAIFFADYKEKVLVHCTAGIDRSPFVVAKYLVDKEQFKTMREAYAFIKKKRPQICEHYEWIWWHQSQ